MVDEQEGEGLRVGVGLSCAWQVVTKSSRGEQIDDEKGEGGGRRNSRNTASKGGRQAGGKPPVPIHAKTLQFISSLEERRRLLLFPEVFPYLALTRSQKSEMNTPLSTLYPIRHHGWGKRRSS